MSFLAASDQKALRILFEQLSRYVNLIYFTQEQSVAGEETQKLLEEITALSDKLHLEVHDFAAASALAAKHRIERTPALVLASEVTRGKPRFFGLPGGHEFPTLLGSLLDASSGETDLSATAKETVAAIDEDVHIQV